MFTASDDNPVLTDVMNSVFAYLDKNSEPLSVESTSSVKPDAQHIDDTHPLVTPTLYPGAMPAGPANN